MLKHRQALNKLFFFYFLLAVLCYSTTSYDDQIKIRSSAHSSYLLKAQKPIHESVCLIGSGNKVNNFFNDIELDNSLTSTLVDSPSLYQRLELLDYSYYPCHKEKIRIVAPNKIHWLSSEVRDYPFI